MIIDNDNRNRTDGSGCRENSVLRYLHRSLSLLRLLNSHTPTVYFRCFQAALSCRVIAALPSFLSSLFVWFVLQVSNSESTQQQMSFLNKQLLLLGEAHKLSMVELQRTGKDDTKVWCKAGSLAAPTDAAEKQPPTGLTDCSSF